MSTVQSIIDGGFAKFAAARPESFTAGSELITEVGNALRAVFQVLARENPYIIGASAPINFDGAKWPRPTGCFRVIRVEADSGTLAAPMIAAGTEITVVPMVDRYIAAGSPSLYEFAQAFYPVGQSVDPSGGTITMFYARAPQMPTTTGEAVDALFPSDFDDYLKWAVAAYLAQKDQRDLDTSTARANQAAVLAQIVEWARSQTFSLVQRFPLTSPPLTSTNNGAAQPLKGQQ